MLYQCKEISFCIYFSPNTYIYTIQNAISENGEWGVKAVSDRLIAFAKAISGNDKAKAGELRDAITQGFREAERLLGGQLPEISQKTYDATMKKLDDWTNSED